MYGRKSVGQIKVSPTGKGTVVVTEAYKYKDIVVPVGFESDGATIPKILWSIYPPFFPDYLTACVLHDFLCRAELYGKADRYFQQILERTNVQYTTRRNLVIGVKMWHSVAYNKDNSPRWWVKILSK